ncbi:MAG TPA: hypothetical protein VMA72_10020 [Streptosporangiaceae bacterium]|nr:hypothetical protein [Streptosporangiaceae bacterium]
MIPAVGPGDVDDAAGQTGASGQFLAGLTDTDGEHGEIRRPGIGADIAIDILFSPIVYRLLLGHAPLGPAEAAQFADAALSGLLTPATTKPPGAASRR